MSTLVPMARRSPLSKPTRHVPVPRTSSLSTQIGESKPNSHSESPLTHFETEAGQVLGELSRALAALIAQLPEAIDRPRHLQRVLGIDYTLAWRVFKVATAENPVSAGSDVPRAGPMNRFLDAASGHEAKPRSVSRVRKAFAAFEDLVHRHAGEAPTQGRGGGRIVGGRAVFDSLIGGVQDEGTSNRDLVHRRATYKGNSHLWGMQARVGVQCAIYHRGSNPSAIDGLMIYGYSGLHGLRKNVPLRLMTNSGAYDTNDPDAASKPLRPPGEEFVLEKFSSQPLPLIRTSRGTLGMMETSLRFEAIGKAAALDVFTETVWRDIYEGKPQAWFGATKAMTVPNEIFVHDMLVPRGWVDVNTMQTSTHGNVSMLESLVPRVPEFEMPMKEKVQYLGSSRAALETPDLPRYREMVESVLNEQGWADTEYDIFRVRVHYPIMHTLLHLRVDAAK